MATPGKTWMVPAAAALLLLAVALPGRSAAAAAPTGPPPASLFSGFADGSRIDAFVLAKLKAAGIPPSERCADDVFIRRVYLDVLGTLPTPEEVREFLADRRPDKRSRLIDRVLDRPEFAEYLGLKWCDLLRVKSEFPSNLWPNAVQAYDRWIRAAFRDRMPYDRFARELLTASGSNFRAPPVNFYRAFQERTPQQIAANVALVFMGLRLENSGWTEEQTLAFSAFFAKIGYKSTDEWKEEIVFMNPDGKLSDPKTGRPVAPAVPGNSPLRLDPDADPRAAFAEWLTAPGNPWFARNAVNRIWFWLLGSDIAGESGDMRPGQAPWSPELLAFLEKELVARHYDLRHVYRLILNSNTYQASAVPNAWNAADDAGFSHYRLRRLDAEVLLDAINQIFGSGETYTSEIPEPFTFLPRDQRAISLADGSIASTFLELFGRPPRNTSFDTERSSAPSVFQAQHLLNSSHIQKKIQGWAVLRQLQARPAAPPSRPGIPSAPPVAAPGNAKLIEDLYLRILSRLPTDAERQAADAYLSAPKRSRYESACDLAWALVNTKEFSVRH